MSVFVRRNESIARHANFVATFCCLIFVYRLCKLRPSFQLPHLFFFFFFAFAWTLAICCIQIATGNAVAAAGTAAADGGSQKNLK